MVMFLASSSLAWGGAHCGSTPPGDERASLVEV